MKNTLRSVSILMLFAAAGLAQAADSAKAVIDGYMAAWNAHDAEKAASYFAEDGVYFDATVGTPQKGREAARDVGSYEVTPCLPVDVLGVYVLLPASL